MQGLRTVSFFGTCAAGSSVVLCSKRITSPFFTKDFIASFALNTGRTLKTYFFISPDPSCPSSGEPTGVNCLQSVGQVSYLVGDDERKQIKHEIFVAESGYYLKIYAVNSDVYDHTVDSQIIIDLESRD